MFYLLRKWLVDICVCNQFRHCFILCIQLLVKGWKQISVIVENLSQSVDCFHPDMRILFFLIRRLLICMYQIGWFVILEQGCVVKALRWIVVHWCQFIYARHILSQTWSNIILSKLRLRHYLVGTQ